MAREELKDFNKMLNDKKDFPKITTIEDEKGQKKWGGKTLVIAPPTDYDELMKKVPQGKIATSNQLRKEISKKYNVEVCCPLTAGIFTNICAWASVQREKDKTPYWRTVKSDGELNAKYPGGIEAQKLQLESEGLKIICKGKNKRYYIENFEKYLYTF